MPESDNRGIHPWKRPRCGAQRCNAKTVANSIRSPPLWGPKPSSRARKDEIIQLIIDLTADGARIAPPSETGSPESAPESAPDATAESDGRSAFSPAAKGNDGDADGANGQNGDSQNGGNGDPVAAEPRDSNRVAERNEDEVEVGNRRRRRRSRDRDRDREDRLGRRPRRGDGPARPPGRGIRLPESRGLPAEPQRRLCARQDDPPVRIAPRRPAVGHVPPGEPGREEPGPADPGSP